MLWWLALAHAGGEKKSMMKDLILGIMSHIFTAIKTLVITLGILRLWSPSLSVISAPKSRRCRSKSIVYERTNSSLFRYRSANLINLVEAEAQRQTEISDLSLSEKVFVYLNISLWPHKTQFEVMKLC